MSIAKYIKIVAIMSFSLSSCKSKFACPEFDVSLLNKEEISFLLNDTIYYSSNTNDTLMFIVVDFIVKAPVVLSGRNKECYYPASYSTNEINGISINEIDYWNFSFGDDKEYIFPWWTGIVENDNKCQYTKDKEFNGVVYSFVFEAEDLSGNRRIDRFVKVANRGIIEFHDKATGLTWRQVLE